MSPIGTRSSERLRDTATAPRSIDTTMMSTCLLADWPAAAQPDRPAGGFQLSDSTEAEGIPSLDQVQYASERPG